MKASRFAAVVIMLAIFLIPSTRIYAETSVTLQSFFGEGSYQDGYDFSADAIQRWGEGGPDNPSLSPDFYLGDPFAPLTTSEFYELKYTIDYGTVLLASITEIPDHADPRFALLAGE